MLSFTINDVNIQTKKTTIINFFGDLIADINNITDEEYQSIISRCESNNWKQWKDVWQIMKNNNFEDLTQ